MNPIVCGEENRLMKTIRKQFGIRESAVFHGREGRNRPGQGLEEKGPSDRKQSIDLQALGLDQFLLLAVKV
jgi:hypothetical protein